MREEHRLEARIEGESVGEKKLRKQNTSCRL